jgi:hypothetical protein
LSIVVVVVVVRRARVPGDFWVSIKSHHRRVGKQMQAVRKAEVNLCSAHLIVPRAAVAFHSSSRSIHPSSRVRSPAAPIPPVLRVRSSSRRLRSQVESVYTYDEYNIYAHEGDDEERASISAAFSGCLHRACVDVDCARQHTHVRGRPTAAINNSIASFFVFFSSGSISRSIKYM